MSSKKKNDYLSSIQKMNDTTKIYILIGIIFTILFGLIGYIVYTNMSSNQTTTSYLSIIENMDENTVSLIIGAFTIIVIIFYIWHIIYMNGLQKSECNKMNSLYPSVDGNLRPIRDSDADCRGKLFDYYIKTAYNACSGGSYKNDYVDICILKAIIKQGVRCLDFEVYSIDDQPVVATSTTDNYRVKETFNSVNFVTVMDTIRNYAFSGGSSPNPTDPILIHLRIKSNNQKMYSKLAEIFRKNTDIMLGPAYSYNSDGKNLGTAPLLSLKNKVILIVDRTNTAFLENEELLEYINLTSNSIFMRAYDYNSIKNNSDISELKEYNKYGMTIVFPDNGSNPSNPDGKLCRENGCQMVAMRYQLSDKNLKENIDFFDRAQYAFAIKPVDLRHLGGEDTRLMPQSKPTSTKNTAPKSESSLSFFGTSFGQTPATTETPEITETTETAETTEKPATTDSTSYFDSGLTSFGSGLTSFGNGLTSFGSSTPEE